MGRHMVDKMNAGHAAVSDWAMEYLTGLEVGTIAELGCGGGRNIGQLLERFPNATVIGLDYSPISVKKAKSLNRDAIRTRRCNVMEGDVSHMNFPSGCFDLATAFETVYFWPGPLVSFREVYRVLKPDGRFVIVHDTDGTKEIDQEWAQMIHGMNLYTEYQLEAYLKEAGFAEIKIVKEPQKRWICVIGKKQWRNEE